MARSAVISTCALLALATLGGCGDSESDNEETPSPGPLQGPTAPDGDIDQSAATLRSEEGFTTLAETQVTTRGDRDALLAGQVQLLGGQQPELRLRVDGKTEQRATVDTMGEAGSKVAVVSCACKLGSGDHIVVIEGAAPKSGGSAKVGVRTIVAFPDVKLEGSGSTPVSSTTLNTDVVKVDAEGATLAETSPGPGAGSDPLIILAALRAPRSGVGSENVRTEVVFGEDPPNDLARSTIPSGKIVAYYDSDGAEPGETIELRGFTTAGETPVSVSSIIVCTCGLAR